MSPAKKRMAKKAVARKPAKKRIAKKAVGKRKPEGTSSGGPRA